MADSQQVQDLAFNYQRAVNKSLSVVDELSALHTYYVAYNLGANESFPEDAFDGTSLEGRVDRAMFREIVSICNQLTAVVNAPGVRNVLMNIASGVPNE
jgi:hypothetical protein